MNYVCKMFFVALISLLFASSSMAAPDNFILLKGGNFKMGSPSTERQRQKDEVMHTVAISPFYIDPYEVTQRDYQKIMGKNPSKFRGEKRPVENVTWYDAVEFCNRLSKARGLTPAYTVSKNNTVTWDRTANGYRLLTEAEWEYACRAGTKTIYSFGNQVHSRLANFEGSYPYLIEENYVRTKDPSVRVSENRDKTINVGSLPPNNFGLYDMHGNVSEWCFDYYAPYDTKTLTNPSGGKKGHLRVNRGGGFNDFGKHLRAAYRSIANPIDSDENLGFRICRNAKEGTGKVVTTYSLNIKQPDKPKILIAYFSYSGNTERAAKIIKEKTGGDLFEITMTKPYQGNIYFVSQQDLMSGARPKLATHIKDFSKYDIILLGYPTWWATMPMPVWTFLESYDFGGKIVYSFSSHGGTVFGDSVSDLCKEILTAYVGQGFEFNYSGGRDLKERISAWLKQCGIRELKK